MTGPRLAGDSLRAALAPVHDEVVQVPTEQTFDDATIHPRAFRLAETVVSVLTDELRRPPWRGSPNPVAGHCYVASEALWHLLGGSDSVWRPYGMSHEDASHWWLQHDDGTILDATADQFSTPVPYRQGRRRAFLTQTPSHRAKVVLSRVERLEAGPVDPV